MNIYYANFYKINSGFPKLIYDLSIKANSINDAWNEAINIAFGSGDQELKMMVRIIEEEIQF